MTSPRLTRSRATVATIAAAGALASSLMIAPPVVAAQQTSHSPTVAALSSPVLDAVTRHAHDKLGSGARHMESTVTWFPAHDGSPSRVVGSTRTWNDVKLTGFTGSVIVLFKDAHGRTVGYSPIVRPLGVDGQWIGRSDRTDHWTLFVSPEQTAGAVSIEIGHSRASWDRTQEQVARAKAWLEPAALVARLLTAL